MQSRRWEDKLIDFCKRYDLEIEYLAEVLNDPKVVPMIRGKSFEFSAKKYLAEILSDKYKVINPRLNAQTGQHDIDIAITNTHTGKKYSVECKLASKDCSIYSCLIFLFSNLRAFIPLTSSIS